jgi:hypothetical protein
MAPRAVRLPPVRRAIEHRLPADLRWHYFEVVFFQVEPEPAHFNRMRCPWPVLFCPGRQHRIL